MRRKIELEYIFSSSVKVLFSRLSTPAGLSEWFADDVFQKGNQFIFIWNGSEQPATLVELKSNAVVRFRWDDAEEEDEYFEFNIHVEPLTGDVALIITDFADEDEVNDTIELWNKTNGYPCTGTWGPDLYGFDDQRESIVNKKTYLCTCFEDFDNVQVTYWQMKKLHIFMLKSFIGPFVATFFISMFVLIMQFLWRMIDEIVGKGLEFTVIAELLIYVRPLWYPWHCRWQYCFHRS